MHRRYTIFNLYIRGSNQSPQAAHALNNLWKSVPSMTEGARTIFNDWANNSEIEIMLQGGYHKDLEDLYEQLTNVKDLPCAKFNESMEALNGACTVVTFVATPRIVAANKFIRDNRLTPANAADYLSEMSDANIQKAGLDSPLTESEIFVASKVAFLSLAS